MDFKIKKTYFKTCLNFGSVLLLRCNPTKISRRHLKHRKVRYYKLEKYFISCGVLHNYTYLQPLNLTLWSHRNGSCE